jgi:hypothetical protein
MAQKGCQFGLYPFDRDNHEPEMLISQRFEVVDFVNGA